MWSSALGWKEEGEEVVLGGKDCRVVCRHYASHQSALLWRYSRQTGNCAEDDDNKDDWLTSIEYYSARLQHSFVAVETLHQLLLPADG